MRSPTLMLVAVLGACSPSLTTLQPARTVPAGHFQVSASVQGTPPVGMAGEALETAHAIDELNSPTARELEALIESASAALIAPPSVDAQLGIGYGVTRRFELDAKIGPTGFGAGFRIQLLRRSPGIYIALGAMAHVQFADFDIERFTDAASIQSMSRYDFSFPLSFGYSGRFVHLWGGPKLVMTRFAADFSLCLDSRGGACRREAVVTSSGRASHLAGQLGLAVGKGRVWVAAELTVARVWVDGSVDFEMRSSRQNSEFSRSGRIVSPAIGLLTWF